MGTLNENIVQKKFESLQPTQENIETVSLWCLHHKDYHSMIVGVWIKCFKTVTLKQRLSLIYVANDVCQRERQKKFSGFRKSFATVLKEAITIIRSDEIRANVERIVDIWIERDIFDGDFANELKGILKTSQSNSTNEKSSLSAVNEKWLAEFKLESLIAELEKQKNEKQSLQRAQGLLPNVPFTSDGNVKSYLKDRQEGLKYAKEIDLAHKKLSDFVIEMERQLQGQSRLIGLLEQAKIFYETQLSEAIIVEAAYRKFGSGVQVVKQELYKMKSSGLFPPRDSPLIDAPSPAPNDDPFAQGVEAVVAKHHRTFDRNEPVDMDLEEEGQAPTTSRSSKMFETTVEGLKLNTNRSFLPSDSTSNGRLGAETSPKYVKYDLTTNEIHPTSSKWTNNQFYQPNTNAPASYANQAATQNLTSVTPPRHAAPVRGPMAPMTTFVYDHQSVPHIATTGPPPTNFTFDPSTKPRPTIPFDVTSPPPPPSVFAYGNPRLPPQGTPPSIRYPSPASPSTNQHYPLPATVYGKSVQSVNDQAKTSNLHEIEPSKQFTVPNRGINERNLTVLSSGGDQKQSNSNDNRFRSPPPTPRFHNPAAADNNQIGVRPYGQSLLGSAPSGNNIIMNQFTRPQSHLTTMPPPSHHQPQNFPMGQPWKQM